MNIENQQEYFSKTFDGLDVGGSHLSEVIFEGCAFLRCNFSEVSFYKCKFVECTFTASNLSNVVVSHSKFLDVDFHESKVIGIDWTKADWPRFSFSAPFKFTECILNDSSFFGLNFTELTAEHCKAHDVDFRNGNFSKANFSYTDFAHSLFLKTNLKEADFSEAQNYSINIFENEIAGARFSRYEAISLLDCLNIELVD